MDTIGTDNPFTTAQEDTIVAFAAALIPASAEYDVPSAGDPAIAQEILAVARGAAATVAAAVRTVDAMAQATHCAAFRDLDEAARTRQMAGVLQPGRQQAEHTADAGGIAGQRALASIVLQCYYRDDRVMRSLGMDARPPFPKGFDVEQGDWSLLDPVKRRGTIYRPVAGSCDE